MINITSAIIEVTTHNKDTNDKHPNAEGFQHDNDKGSDESETRGDEEEVLTSLSKPQKMVQVEPHRETKKIHSKQKSHCSPIRKDTNPIRLHIGSLEQLPLYAKFMEASPNKRKMKGDVFFLSYKQP